MWKKENRYRGKHINKNGIQDIKEWLYGDLIQTHNETFICDNYTVIDDFIQAHALEVIQETVGQYTGLKDKNKTRVYEGDIVKSNDYIFVVKLGEHRPSDFSDIKELGIYLYCIEKKERAYNLRKDIIWWIRTYKIEIIGNIHDNPELMVDNQR